MTQLGNFCELPIHYDQVGHWLQIDAQRHGGRLLDSSDSKSIATKKLVPDLEKA